MIRDRVVIAGSLDFPRRNAAAQMMEGVALALQDAGVDVELIGRATDPDTCNKEITTTLGISATLPINDSSKYAVRGMLSAILRASRDRRATAVFLYNPNSALLLLLLILKRRLRANIVIVVTEWYNRPSFKDGALHASVKWIDTSLRMRGLLRRADGLILSSTFLQAQYPTAHSVVIPGVAVAGSAPPQEIEECYFEREFERLMLYAGTPFVASGREMDAREMKDRLDVAIDILTSDKLKNVPYRFEIYGLTSDAYLTAVPRHAALLEAEHGRIAFMGQRPAEEVRKRLRQAHYTVLLRDTSRLTLAGFPTKVIESVAAGTPPILSDTGDVSKYIHHRINGIILPDDFDARVMAVKEALELSEVEHRAMRDSCLQAPPFSLEGTGEKLRLFLSRLPSTRGF